MHAVVLFCLIAHWASGQETLRFVNFSSADGLADNRVACIGQDSRGFMWFGTNEGLSRFDGAHFLNFFADPGDDSQLPDNNVLAIQEFKPGHLVILAGTRLCCLNTYTHRFYEPAFAKGRDFYFLEKDGTHGFLCSTGQDVLFFDQDLRLTDSIHSPLRVSKLPPLAWRLSGTWLLIGQFSEYYLYNRQQKQLQPLLSAEQMPQRERIMIFQYYDSVRQQLFFSNYFEGIFEFDLSGKLVRNWSLARPGKPFQNGNFRFVAPRNDSTLWLGNAEGQGLINLSLQTGDITFAKNRPGDPGSLAGNSLLSYYRDRSGTEWFGTPYGVSRLAGKPLDITSWDLGDAGKKDGNYGWLTIRKTGDHQFYATRLSYPKFWRIDGNTGETAEQSVSVPAVIWSMAEMGNRIVLTGSGNRITSFNLETGTFALQDFLQPYYPQSDVVVMAFRQKNGDEWYSGNAGGGFVRIRASDRKIFHYTKDGPAGSFVISYYPYCTEDGKGDLWFGVNKSSRLLHWDSRREHFDEIPLTADGDPGSSSLKGITELITDSAGHIWIGMDGSGIVDYDPEKRIQRRYTIAQGLSSDYISSMAFDDRGRLWIGTIKGLNCFIPAEHRFLSFSSKDGLADDQYADRCILFDRQTRHLWIGGATKLARFRPDDLVRSGVEKLPVYVDGVLVNNRYFADHSLTNLSFDPGDNTFQFTFTGLDPQNKGGLVYSYRLDGADDDWVAAAANNVSYNNLGPGKYKFVVRARRRGSSDWTETDHPFSFVILTPWYQTWWFRLLLIASAIALAWWLIRNYYRSKLQRQRVIMEKEIAIEQERTKMARELHDGLGSMLSGIKHSFAAMTQQIPLDNRQKHVFDSNVDKLNETIRELRNISHNMASDSLLKYGLENSLRDYCRNMSLFAGIPITFTALQLEELSLPEEKSMHIFRIIQELFQNIIKHAAAKQVVMQLSHNNGRLYVTVEDDGKGFDLGEVSRGDGIGLKNIESRVRLLQGELDIQTAPGKGTSVLVALPVSSSK